MIKLITLSTTLPFKLQDNIVRSSFRLLRPLQNVLGDMHLLSFDIIIIIVVIIMR